MNIAFLEFLLSLLPLISFSIALGIMTGIIFIRK